jgi:hypothetical protein
MEKKHAFLNKAGLALLTVLGGITASADPLPVPRAGDIQSLAGNCKIGPFEQVSKAGRYNEYCTTLTDGEKCLAMIKGYMSEEGVLREIQDDYDKQRMAYCLENFKNEFKLGQD